MKKVLLLFFIFFLRLSNVYAKGIEVTDSNQSVRGNNDFHLTELADSEESEGNILSGSHGCVNTPYDKEVLFFNYANVGTPVLVY